MSLSTTAEFNIASGEPDRMIMLVPGISGARARKIANEATFMARSLMPKMSGASASRMYPIYGKGYFGVAWKDSYVWFQDHGINPFTMKNLAGKTIPMWIDDPTGKERNANPKAKVRTTMSGKIQVLIFRKVAKPGQTRTKIVRDKKTGSLRNKQVPASYPGAAGRINKRQASKPFTTRGTQGGQIAKGNGGVRWRHPGLAPREFLNHSLTYSAQLNGILPIRVYAADDNFRTKINMRLG